MRKEGREWGISLNSWLPLRKEGKDRRGRGRGTEERRKDRWREKKRAKKSEEKQGNDRNMAE